MLSADYLTVTTCEPELVETWLRTIGMIAEQSRDENPGQATDAFPKAPSGATLIFALT
jgi:hypothetical protein